MALKKKEAALLEAVSGMLSQKAKVGLHNLADNETSHTSQFRWEGIDDAYALKVSDLTFFESVTSAFFQVHSYKYIDHPTFKTSFATELKNRAVPQTEMDEAIKAVDSLITELSEKNPSEKDAGWNPNLKEIMDMTRNADNREPSKEAPFTGGGPWAEHDESYIDLMVVEGVIPNKDAAPYAMKFRKLQSVEWTQARPHMVNMVAETAKAGLNALSSRIGSYIDAKDNKVLGELWTRNDELKTRLRPDQFDPDTAYTDRPTFIDDQDPGAYDAVCGMCGDRMTEFDEMNAPGLQGAAKDPRRPSDMCPRCWDEVTR